MDDVQRVIDSSLRTDQSVCAQHLPEREWSAALLQRFVNKVFGASDATVQ